MNLKEAQSALREKGDTTVWGCLLSSLRIVSFTSHADKRYCKPSIVDLEDRTETTIRGILIDDLPMFLARIVGDTPDEWDQMPAQSKKIETIPRVYFIQGVIVPTIKIGVAKDVKSRFQELQRMSPEPLRLLVSIPGGYSKETELHTLFREAHSHGEWFFPAPALLAYIAKQQHKYRGEAW